MVVTIDGFSDSVPAEDSAIRTSLDDTLAKLDKYGAEVSALMLFPHQQWLRRRSSMSRQEFYDWYLTQYLPRLKARNQLNCRGTYFERMIRFRGTRRSGNRQEPFERNQLEQIITDWNRAQKHGRRPRRSSMQAACFDPPKDHNGSALSPFPCLQQVGFTYDDDGRLAVNAYYPTQYVFDRAYGNYLGLARLGAFMATELGLELARLTCFIGQPELGRGITKARLQTLADIVRGRLLPMDADAA